MNLDAAEPPYLQVRNAAGELLGLMRGPFPASPHQCSSIAFYTKEDERMVRRDFDVRAWLLITPQCEKEVVVCLRTGLSLDELRHIPQFR